MITYDLTQYLEVREHGDVIAFTLRLEIPDTGHRHLNGAYKAFVSPEGVLARHEYMGEMVPDLWAYMVPQASVISDTGEIPKYAVVKIGEVLRLGGFGDWRVEVGGTRYQPQVVLTLVVTA